MNSDLQRHLAVSRVSMPMLRSILIGALGGMRSLTPVAVVSDAARRRRLTASNAVPRLLSSRLASRVALLLAAGEMLGDKLPSAPDRVIAPGLLARLLTGAAAGMAVAPRSSRNMAAVLGAASAIGAAHLTFKLRKRAMHRWGQVQTGLVEDAITLAGSIAVVKAATRD